MIIELLDAAKPVLDSAVELLEPFTHEIVARQIAGSLFCMAVCGAFAAAFLTRYVQKSLAGETFEELFFVGLGGVLSTALSTLCAWFLIEAVVAPKVVVMEFFLK